MKFALLVAGFALALFASACSEDPKPKGSWTTENTGYARFAKGFEIDTIPGFQVLTIHNPWNPSDRASQWLLVDSTKICPECTIPDSLLWLPRINIPLRRVIVLSSTHLALLAELNLLDRVVGVARMDLIRSQSIRSKLDTVNLPQTGYGPELQVETVVQLTPDAVFTFGVGDERFDDYPKLNAARVQTLVLSEWTENSPLGRLEWIRMMGVLFQKEHLADSIFADRATRYDSLLTLASKAASHPAIMTGTPQGETWFMTGGRNYFAQLMRDAGGNYLWESDTSQGFQKSSLEQVLLQAENADFWLNPGILESRKQALESEPRVALFRAFRENSVYSHANGDFWELGMVRPDYVLADLISILHPELMPDYILHFYRVLP
jgi:iron complex transport system substrate-binding protein